MSATSNHELASLFASSNVLLSEIRNHSDITNWADVFSLFGLGLLQPKAFASLSKLQKLALAIVIVGAQETNYFMISFRILSEWEGLGGPYWVIQVEILRHKVLSVYERELKLNFPYKLKYCSKVLENLDRIIPDEVPSCIKNPTLRKKMISLKVEFGCLADDLKTSNNPEKKLGEFSAKTPLHSFVNWFMKWAQKTVKKLCPDDIISDQSVKSYPSLPAISSHAQPNNHVCMQTSVHSLELGLDDEFPVNPICVTKSPALSTVADPSKAHNQIDPILATPELIHDGSSELENMRHLQQLYSPTHVASASTEVRRRCITHLHSAAKTSEAGRGNTKRKLPVNNFRDSAATTPVEISDMAGSVSEVLHLTSPPAKRITNTDENSSNVKILNDRQHDQEPTCICPNNTDTQTKYNCKSESSEIARANIMTNITSSQESNESISLSLSQSCGSSESYGSVLTGENKELRAGTKAPLTVDPSSRLGTGYRPVVLLGTLRKCVRKFFAQTMQAPTCLGQEDSQSQSQSQSE